MRSPVTGIVALLLLLVVAIVGYSSLFSVDQTEQALVVRLGEPVGVATDPGLHFKAPFIAAPLPAGCSPRDVAAAGVRPAADRARRPGRRPAAR